MKDISLQSSFDKNFSKYKKEPIGLYGIGVNSKRILNTIHGYNFVAVIANDHIGESFEGYIVSSLEDSVRKIKILIIAATISSTSIIYQRIGQQIPEDVLVFDMRGIQMSDFPYSNDSYWNSSLEGLLHEIDSHECISFDLFDTLLMRKALEPKNIFRIMETVIQSWGFHIPFARWRMDSERDAWNECFAPTIHDIYRVMMNRFHMEKSLVERVKDLEIETELSFLCPRYDMVYAFHYAKAQGKEIYISTDMYLPSLTLKKMLENFSIVGYHKLFVSCDIKKTKASGSMFEIIQSSTESKRILHIGDDLESDVVRARENGLDAYWVMKSYDMLAHSTEKLLLDKSKTMADNILLGSVLAKIHNSPFILGEGKGRLTFHDVESLSVFCFSAVTMQYLSHIVHCAKNHPNACVLFVSRDGYFLQKLYKKISSELALNLPPSKYFYSSRQVMNRAMMLDDESLKMFLKTTYNVGDSSNLRESLEPRLGVELDETFDCSVDWAIRNWGTDGLFRRLLAYRKNILRVAKENRDIYLKYIRSMGLENFSEIILVDLVTRGTVAYGLQRILNRPVVLEALGIFQSGYTYCDKISCVSSLYGYVTRYSEISPFFEFLERIYASKEGQLVGFSETGKPIFDEDSCYHPVLIEKAQKALEQFVMEYPMKDFFCHKFSSELVLGFLEGLLSRHSTIDSDVIDLFTFWDPILNENVNSLVRVRG